jgi:radical SAM superfamily enzyme with C-terminal helix-hairpin-helix motif
MLKVTILDGYVDEPTCLGVPPYISPYPRYVAGAVWCFDKTAGVSYVSIDQVRNDSSLLKVISECDLLVVVAGMAVPGRYFSGFPVSPFELVSLLSQVDNPVKVLCGPAARYGFGLSGGRRVKEIGVVKDVFDVIASGDGEIVVFDLLKNDLDIDSVDPSQCRRSSAAIKDFAVKGAKIVQQHPFFPVSLICEIETFRGCPRGVVGGCSFCSEPSRGAPDFRMIDDVVDEVQALYCSGVRHFRVGNQPCIFSYMAKDAVREEFPKPDPDAVEKLFRGIRYVAPNLKTLHIDNANPGEIARYPEECRRIAKSIIRYHTPGDVAAFGVESADPVVIKKNNLKASPEEVMFAVKLLNEVGSKRGFNGLPELLPGLNFISGLIGETKNTFELNYDFLKQILDEGLLLRRINLRQVIPIPGTEMFEFGDRNIKKHKSEFQRFKRKIKEDIERPMLKRLVPMGTVLKRVFTEGYKGKLTFCRQIGSYPLLVGIPGVYPLHRFFDVKVVDYGYRSITALPYPLDINNAPRRTIEMIPGVGKKRAGRILAGRPFRDNRELVDSLDDPDVGKKLLEYIG